MDKELKWYVVYTKSRSEKKINERLEKIGIETYLPLIKTLRQWSDRKKKVEIPLINSYIFVKANKLNYTSILNTEGVINFIKFENKHASIPDNQINNLKILMQDSNDITVSNNEFIKGEKIKIEFGKFKGYNGEIKELKGKHKLIVYIQALNTSFSLEISVENVSKV